MTIISSCELISPDCPSNLTLKAENIEKIKRYDDCEATISGIISSTYIDPDGKVVFINVGNIDYKKAFNVVIFSSDFPKFNSLENIKEYEGNFIQVYGTISTYRNRPQIIVNDPEQITLQVRL